MLPPGEEGSCLTAVYVCCTLVVARGNYNRRVQQVVEEVVDTGPSPSKGTEKARLDVGWEVQSEVLRVENVNVWIRI